MASRLKLHNELKELLGSNYVYFQPPESVKLHFPCIVYARSSGDTDFADNISYRYTQQYEITVIDPNPDSEYIDKMIHAFSMITFNRHYTVDNLNHDVFKLFY